MVVLGRVEAVERAGDAADRDAVAQADVPVAQERERAGPDEGDDAVLRDDRKRQRRAARGARLADPVEEIHVGRAAAERDVLAVVGRRRRIALALGQRLHRAAERRPGLEQCDVVARIHEIERSGDPGQASSDNDRSHLRLTMARTLAAVERLGREEKTSKPVARMRLSSPT